MKTLDFFYFRMKADKVAILETEIRWNNKTNIARHGEVRIIYNHSLTTNYQSIVSWGNLVARQDDALHRQGALIYLMKNMLIALGQVLLSLNIK